MLCVFLKNLPNSFAANDVSNFCGTIDLLQTQQLYFKIAEAAGCQADDVEIHISDESYHLLSHLGRRMACPNVHATIEWHGNEQRNLEVKQTISDAIQEYLNLYSAGKGLDITFRDSPAGTFFVEKDGKSVLIEGGEFIPPNKVLAQVAYEVTGFETPGVITSD